MRNILRQVTWLGELETLNIVEDHGFTDLAIISHGDRVCSLVTVSVNHARLVVGINQSGKVPGRGIIMSTFTNPANV